MSMTNSPLIVVADDDEAVLRAMRHHLKSWGCRVECATNKAILRRLVAEERPAVLLLDVRFGAHDGVEILRELIAEDPSRSVILMTAYGSIDMAVTALKLGASDYLTKPPDLHRLRTLIGDAIAQIEARPAALAVNGSPSTPGRVDQRSGSGPMLVGRSAALEHVRAMIAGVAPTDANVLILGESGTGKEVVARAIHAQSSRREQPFIALNMAALPRELVESTLFGHEKGAYTGADQAEVGSVEAANGGTLFLDEIGEMDVNLQAKLLRFLQERTFQRVGSARLRAVDVRILAATNCNPLEQVRRGLLREDLYYRLNVVPIEIPPLRERRNDVADLATHFLRRVSSRYSKTISGFTPDAMTLLTRYDWPGNVRQLENLIERLVIFCGDPVIGRKLIPQEFVSDAADAPQDLQPLSSLEPEPVEPLRTMDQMEKDAIEQALRDVRGNVREAARRLGIGQATIYRKIKRYGIQSH